MRKMESFKMPNLRRLPTANLLTVKDHSAFFDNSTQTYLTAVTRHLDKLYQSIGMKNLQFVKNLYELDRPYCLSAVQSRLMKTPYSLYATDSELFVYNRKAFSNLMYLLGEIGKFDILYEHAPAAKRTNSYLGLINGIGTFICVSHIQEDAWFYDAEIKDEKVYLMENAKISLTDDGFKDTVNGLLESAVNTHASSFYPKDVQDLKLTWEEVELVYKVLKIRQGSSNKFPVIDTDLSLYQKQRSFSDYTLGDMFHWVWLKLDDPKTSNFLELYIKVCENQFFALSQ